VLAFSIAGKRQKNVRKSRGKRQKRIYYGAKWGKYIFDPIKIGRCGIYPRAKTVENVKYTPIN